MDKEGFEASLKKIQRNGQARHKGIGTLGEKTLHAVIKQYIEPYEGNHEVAVGPFVADIVNEGGIVEIQTGSFQNIRKKLTVFLEIAPVTVVYPIARVKWLIWVDPETGEAAKKRKSPKRGTPCDAFYELYKIKMLLNHPNLRLRLLLLDIEEYRSLNGWSHDRKRGSSRYERIPVTLENEIIIGTSGDYRKLIPPGLPERFTSADFTRCSGLSKGGAQTALNILHHVKAVTRVGKLNRLLLYETASNQS